MAQVNEIQRYIATLGEGTPLSAEESARVFQIILSGGATTAQIGAILMGMKCCVETADEIVGAAQALLKKATLFDVGEECAPYIVDTCGTGGDKKGSYNISTTVAVVVASCGVPVVKHGNKAISSKSGSSDILSALGVNIDTDIDLTKRALEEAGICFLMAPRYHSAMRHVAPVRQELGTRTIFNLLGPLINPARPKRQVVGVYDSTLVEPIAQVLKALGSEHAWVVHGLDGMDELTVMGQSVVAELKDGEIRSFTFDPREYGIEFPEEDDALKGGDAYENAAAFRRVLKGEQNAYRDAVLVNSAAALLVAGKVMTIEAGIAMAREHIDEGKALDTLQALVAVTNDTI